MSTEIWVVIGLILLAIGTYIMWYVPYRESKDKEFEVRETGRISRRLPLEISTPLLCFGESCFLIMDEDHMPIITDGKGDGKLFIPSKRGRVS